MMNNQQREAEALRIAQLFLLNISHDYVWESLDADSSEEDATVIYGLIRSAYVRVGSERP
jgi:hypothetical protein